jgi:hypothetical protein
MLTTNVKADIGSVKRGNVKKAVEQETDLGKIRTIIKNAKREGNADMVVRAERHLATFIGFQDTVLDRRFLECLRRYEQVLTNKNDRKTLAQRLRGAVARNGVRQTVINLAKKVETSFGFEQLIKAGEAKETIEYIIIEMADEFDDVTVRSAYTKLRRAGVTFTNIH